MQPNQKRVIIKLRITKQKKPSEIKAHNKLCNLITELYGEDIKRMSDYVVRLNPAQAHLIDSGALFNSAILAILKRLHSGYLSKNNLSKPLIMRISFGGMIDDIRTLFPSAGRSIKNHKNKLRFFLASDDTISPTEYIPSFTYDISESRVLIAEIQKLSSVALDDTSNKIIQFLLNGYSVTEIMEKLQMSRHRINELKKFAIMELRNYC